MVSISFLVLLLATYCYSVPIDPRVDSSTEIKVTTGRTIIDHENRINMRLMTDEESTGVPNIPKERSVMVDKDELTTPESSEHVHDHMSRSFEDAPFTSSPPMKREMEHPSSAEKDMHDDLHDFHFTTMETKTHFDKKAIGPEKPASEEEGESDNKRSLPVDDIETTTDKDFSTTYKNVHMDESHENSKEHTSSVDSFGKMTGLLKDKRMEKHEDKSSEESTTLTSDKDKRMEELEDKSSEESTTLPSDKEKRMEKPEDRSNEESTTLTSDKEKRMEKHVDKSSEEYSTTPVDKIPDVKDKRKEMEKSEDKSHEETTTHLLDMVPIITKTETILPVKITETKIYVEKQPIVDKKKSDN